MNFEQQQDLEQKQQRLVQALLEYMRNRSGKDVQLLETHISWVLLEGHYAYKIKKAVDLGFLNFSSLQARQHYCEEEIRLNCRLAPAIYLNVIAVGGSYEFPQPGAQPALEYAVMMRRFSVLNQLDVLAQENRLLPGHMDSLAATIAHFHANLPPAGIESDYGTARSSHQAAEDNFSTLQVILAEQNDSTRLQTLHQTSEQEFSACEKLFESRRSLGRVRECHGDLHLGNIVLIDAQPVPFDGIEFSPELRWIDVISEVAFTVMDLQRYKHTGLAYRFLNAYLEASGDYAGMQVLRFYAAYRAMVRAKVSAIHAGQLQLSAQTQAAAWRTCREYMAQAEACFSRSPAALIITHGLPGSGKTSFAQLALERLPGIRLRSDVERKRLCGLEPLADSHLNTVLDLYSPENTARTYAHLLQLARTLLQSAYVVIIDAAFLQGAERDVFRRLAEELSIPFAIASIRADPHVLRERIVKRKLAANDASEADLAVLEKLSEVQQLLSEEEEKVTVAFVNESSGMSSDAASWEKLNSLLKS